MFIDLQRAFTPEEMAEDECALCAHDFRTESVIAFAETNGRTEIGRICPECLEYFGRINPEYYPTIEVYQELLEHYPQPIWKSGEDMERAEEEGFAAAYAASWLYRTPA